MPTTYHSAEPEARPIVDALLAKHYQDLLDAGVTVGLWFVLAPRDKDGEPTGPALKFHGYAAAGIVKVNSLKDRAQGKPDATIFLDGDEWQRWSDDRQRAVLDHELYHLIVKTYPTGTLRCDDLGRPLLKLRMHDVQLGGFKIIAQRYGIAAPEVELAHQAKQMLLFEDFEPEANGRADDRNGRTARGQRRAAKNGVDKALAGAGVEE